MLSALAAVALIVTGDDPAQGASLQRALEEKIAAAGRPVTSTSDLAAALAKLDPTLRLPVVDAVQQQTAQKLLDDAKAAFFDGRFDETAAKLAALSAFLDGAASLPTTNRVDMLLWRAALFLESGSPGSADLPVREALVLAPDVVVTDAVFPPTLVALVKKQRTTPATRVTLAFAQLPANATVLVDDRPVKTKGADGALAATVPAGKHRITATAPGRELAQVSVDARTSMRLALPLALAAPASVRGALDRVATGATLDPAPDDLRTLAKALDADAFVAVRRTAKATSAFVLRGSRVAVLVPASGVTDASLAQWILEQLPVANRGLEFAAGSHLALRTREASGGPGWSGAFGGAGIEASVSQRIGESFAIGLRGWGTPWVVSQVEVKTADGTTERGGGGTSVGGELRALFVGRRWSAGSALALDELQSDDVGGLSLFPSQRRISLDFLLGRKLPAIGGFEPRIEAGLSPIAFVQETPEGASGDSPIGSPSGTLTLGAEKRLRVWKLGTALSTEIRDTRFDGTSGVAITPAPENVRTRDTRTSLRITIGRAL